MKRLFIKNTTKTGHLKKMNKHEIIWQYIKLIFTRLLIASFSILLIYKFVDIDIGIKADSLDVSDILSILLAFFAIGLSVFFYFKSSEESSRFYENSYIFTKEISELLGRIEAGFGEKLRHIDDGYNVISGKFDSLRLERESTQKIVEKDTQQLEIAINEKKKVDEILEKYEIDLSDKQKILKIQNSEIENLQKEINRKTHNIEFLENRMLSLHSSGIENAKAGHLEEINQKASFQNMIATAGLVELLSSKMPKLSSNNAETVLLDVDIDWMCQKLSNKDFQIIKKLGIIDLDGLTQYGIRYIKGLLEIKEEQENRARGTSGIPNTPSQSK